MNRFYGATLQPITKSFVNLDHELAVWIDIAPVHPRGVKRQSDVALPVDRDLPARAAQLGNLIEHDLGRFAHGFAAVFYKG